MFAAALLDELFEHPAGLVLPHIWTLEAFTGLCNLAC